MGFLRKYLNWRRRESAKRADHSQNKEFTIFVQHAHPKHRGIVVDVGAKGKDNSNSFDLLSQYAWRGLLIEGNPVRWQGIENDFGGLDYKLERCVVSDKEGPATFHIAWISSLKPEFVLQFGKIEKSIEVETRRLGSILQQHHITKDFDLLSIDIEGMDIPVLNDLFSTTNYRPKSIWAEL